MPKTESKNKPAGSTAKEPAPSNKRKSQGLDEIDSLFSEKKKQDRQEKQKESERKAAAKKRRSSQMSSASSSASPSSGGRGNKSVLEEKFAVDSRTWVDDGLGGKFNKEGYTGRVEDGVKVFKAHVLNKPGFGQSKDCPFDCDCCFI